jgi:MYXO-CTERM domain-containing protein
VSISSMSVSLVPTPGALALLGVAGLVAVRRRR